LQHTHALINQYIGSTLHMIAGMILVQGKNKLGHICA
jgi:hypothetical protein